MASRKKRAAAMARAIDRAANRPVAEDDRPHATDEEHASAIARLDRSLAEKNTDG
jgi:hypothetical protein